MLARSTGISFVPPSTDLTVSSTSVPTFPLIFAVATSAGMPPSFLPSAARITSPTAIPAPSAGESGKTVVTSRPSGTSLIERPTPLKSPLSAFWNSLVLLGVEVVGEPVVVLLAELVDHAADRAGFELFGRHLLEVALLDERLGLVADRRLGDAVPGQLEVERDRGKRRRGSDEEPCEEAN